MRLHLIAAVAASLALSGCAQMLGGGKLSPETTGRIAESLVARCGGVFEVEAGANTGQIGGTANASIKVRANCPVPKPAPAPTPVETPTIDGLIAGAAPPR